MNLILRLLERFGWIELVWTVDHDGECRLRRVHQVGSERRCDSITHSLSVVLLPDGRTSGKCYVVRWMPYRTVDEVAELNKLYRMKAHQSKEPQ